MLGSVCSWFRWLHCPLLVFEAVPRAIFLITLLRVSIYGSVFLLLSFPHCPICFQRWQQGSVSDALHSRHCLVWVCWAVCALGFIGYTALSWVSRQCLGLFFLLHCARSHFAAVFSCFCLFRTAPFTFSDGSRAVCLIHFTLGTALCGYSGQCVLLASLVTLPSLGF